MHELNVSLLQGRTIIGCINFVWLISPIQCCRLLETVPQCNKQKVWCTLVYLQQMERPADSQQEACVNFCRSSNVHILTVGGNMQTANRQVSGGQPGLDTGPFHSSALQEYGNEFITFSWIQKFIQSVSGIAVLHLHLSVWTTLAAFLWQQSALHSQMSHGFILHTLTFVTRRMFSQGWHQ